MKAVHDHIDAHAEALLTELVELSELNSGSHHLDGLAAMERRLHSALHDLGADPESQDLEPSVVIDPTGSPVPMPLGRLVSAASPRPGRPSVLLLAHYDTVFGREHHFQSTTLDGDTLRGPGVADDKGGIVIMLSVLKALMAADRIDFGWEIIFNPDEELGSPGSRPFLRAAASRHDVGLVFEPSLPGGSLASKRKGSGTFDLVVRGVAAHAGRDHHIGRNAVATAAELAVQFQGLTGQRDGLTVNVSRIDGGGPVNIVPDHAVVRFNARVEDSESQQLVENAVRNASEAHSRDGIAVTVHGGFGRPPKEVTAATTRMFEEARAEAAQLGFDLEWAATGGVCDGNDLAAAGLPNLDNLGPVGGGLHSEDEWVSVESLTQRAKLAAGLIVRLTREVSS